MASEIGIGQMKVRAATAENKSCKQIPLEEAIRLVNDSESLVWVDIVTHDIDEARTVLRDQLGFHELAVEDALSRNERPQLQHYENHIFFAVSVIRPKKQSSDDHEYEELGFFLGEKFLVTVASEPFPEVDAVFAEWTKPKGRLSLGPSMVAHAILDHVTDAYFPALDAIEEKVEDAFEALVAGSDAEMAMIIVTKRELASMRRRLNPTRDVLNGLLRLGEPELSQASIPYFRDVLDHCLRMLEMIDETRDMASSLLDVHLSQVSNRLNNVVKKMTVFATVLMSMSLIAGIYGMNFKSMPELEWLYGYPMSLGIMGVVGSLVVVGFRIAKWI